MAVTSADILGFLNANPGISDAEIVAAMEQYGVSPAQMAQAVGVSEGEVAARVAATVPPGQAMLLGDTWVQPNYRISGSGENQEIGPIEGVSVYKTQGGINDQLPVGTAIQNYAPTGEFVGTGQTQKVDSGLKEFALGSALLFGGLGGGFESLFGGGGAGTAGTIGNTGLTLSELTQLDMALGGAGGTTGALTLAEQLGGLAAGTLTGAAATNVGGTTGMGGGTGLLAGAGGVTGLTAGAGGVIFGGSAFFVSANVSSSLITRATFWRFSRCTDNSIRSPAAYSSNAAV